jgi:alginate O-acetyltransferase complex protein AlgI
MLFNSSAFALFLTVFFFFYWFVFNRNLTSQNLFLLAGNYLFYGWWDYRFLFLLFFLSVLNYFFALLIQTKKQKQQRKFIFVGGLIINLGTLVLFKYFNFFIESFIDVLAITGIRLNVSILNLIIPLGISFYIFLSLSYLIDVYQNKLEASKSFIEVCLTLSFFPIILAGPIQRPSSLLPQIRRKRIFDYWKATDGLRQILWGLFMKVVIADQCVTYVDQAFDGTSTASGAKLIVGIFLFTVQIYADFAGYSNIAIGVGKLLGFDIMRNFAFPYFSRDLREFWRRWNISLTTWFRDYLFFPVAYSISRNIKSERMFFMRSDHLIYIIGISVTWMLTGLWHGANYNFMIWGLIQGFFLIFYHLTIKERSKIQRKLNISNNNKILTLIERLITFFIIMFSWVFFRSNTVGQAFNFISGIFSRFSLDFSEILPVEIPIFIVLFFIIEWIGRDQEYPLATFALKWPRMIRWVFYCFLILLIYQYSGTNEQFIYFQF